MTQEHDFGSLKTESKTMTREVIIRPVLNGWVCVVGCQTVAFTDKQTMLNELSSYYDNPDEVEKRFIGRAVNKTYDVPQPPPQNLTRNVEACAQVAESARR